MSVTGLILAAVLTNAAGVARTVEAVRSTNDTFRLSGRLTFVFSPVEGAICGRLALEDASGATGLFSTRDLPLDGFSAGDSVSIEGYFNDNVIAQPFVKEIRRVSAGTPPPVRPLEIDRMLRGELDWQRVRLQGTLRDVDRSDFGTGWTLLRLHVQGHSLLCTIPPDREKQAGDLTASIGAEVSLEAICAPWDGSLRNRIGHVFWAESFSSLTVLSAPRDPFDVPSIESLGNLHPETLLGLGRHRALGRVIAVWQNRYALLRTAGDQIVNCEFPMPPLPAYGETVEVTGFPASDLYHINLSHAEWRRTEAPDLPAIPAAHGLQFPLRGRTLAATHGMILRVRGRVQRPADAASRLYLDCGPMLLPLDFSSAAEALEGIEPGCEIEAVGTGVLDIDLNHFNNAFPRISGLTTVINRPEDVRILARPPWLTPARAITIAGMAILLVILAFIWNRALNRIASRRKIAERTRLAIELHDSLSQNLTGVACQIAAAKNALATARDEVSPRLRTAERMLGSCRTELSNCLFDLRSDAIDDTDFTAAILKSLRNLTEDCSLSVRFNIQRKLLPDTTAHSILAILRELVANAVRHGEAENVRIAGTIDNGWLYFSVTDDGRGFEANDSPGPREGHFGLQGVRDRLQRLDGTLSIDSGRGRGTKVRAAINLKAKGI